MSVALQIKNSTIALAPSLPSRVFHVAPGKNAAKTGYYFHSSLSDFNPLHPVPLTPSCSLSW
jgi:hypothetical protein